MTITRLAALGFLVAFLVVFSACSPQSSATPTNASSNADIQIRETGSRTTTSTETIRINNCGGKADSKQTAERTFAVNIEGTIGASVGYAVVQANVSAKYGQFRSVSKKQELTAPPGTNMEYVLKWTEQEWIGSLLANGQSGTYNAHAPVAVEQISGNDLGCGVGGQPSANVLPTYTPYATQTPYPTYTPFAQSTKPVVTSPSSTNTPIGMISKILAVPDKAATGGWFQTEIFLKQGDSVSIRHLSGTWWIGQDVQGTWGSQSPVDANGYVGRDGERATALVGGATDRCKVLSTAPYGSLIGRIGNPGPTFLVGNNLDFKATASGILYLGINYVNHNFKTNCPYGDQGELTVSVGVRP